ncbi:MAG: sigma-70 family RNA polymerase sigma factor [Lachnospiraceae bacterium]|nr:sigma-70 family RNA polymerase sigma factor [Lachnospiraceae bacterium]
MRQPIEKLIKQYQTNLFVTAFNICKNVEDAKDVVQDTFIAYHTSSQQFHDEQHIRAWLFRVTVNKAKDTVKSFWHRNRRPLEDYIEALPFESEEDSYLFEAVLKLPEKYRIVIHLFYYEDWSVREIAQILRISESNVKTRLSRGRTRLKNVLKEEWADDE